MEAFSPKLFTSKSLERMYNEGSNNLKRGLPMKKSQICLCSAAAHALDFIDYGNKHPDYSKMKSLSLDAANGRCRKRSVGSLHAMLSPEKSQNS